jgi:beta-glucosidase-like glycosyl hydrolase
MLNPGRRRLMKIVGTGALASRAAWAAEAGSAGFAVPKVLVNAISMRLKKTPSGTTVFAVDFGGTLDSGGHLHAVGGQLEFTHMPSPEGLARAVKNSLIQQMARVPGVSLRTRDITVVGPSFH